MRRDQRSPEADAWRRLYKSPLWINGRLAYLSEHPLCERCQVNGRVQAATVVHHRQAHKGDPAKFFSRSNWQSLCAPCHDRDAQSEERSGFSKNIGDDGWPTDRRHPANR